MNAHNWKITKHQVGGDKLESFTIEVFDEYSPEYALYIAKELVAFIEEAIRLDEEREKAK